MLLLTAAVVSAAGCGGKTVSSGKEVSSTEAPVTEGPAGTYTFMEDAMGGQFQVPWTLKLKEDGAYELVCENGMMGTSTYTGTYTVEDGIVTTSPLEGGDTPLAAWFESDYSCQWMLKDETCVPVKYGGSGDAEKQGDLPEGGIPEGIDGKLSGMETEGAIDAAYTNVAYASQSEAQICDIYLPEGEGPFPVIVVVHGGGFAFGAQNMAIVQPIFAAAVEHGYAVVSVDYRKSGEAAFPAAVADVKAAVRFVKANAGEYGFDPEHVAVWGESAGAYLSLMTALTPEVEALNGDVTDNSEVSSQVTALVDFYGPVEFYTMDEEYKALGVEHDLFASDASFESKFLGQNVGSDKEKTYETYWETYAEELPGDFTLSAWIQAGDADTSVPYTQSENFAERLSEVIGGDHVSFGIIGGADHEDAAFYTEENLSEVFVFLDAVMK